MVDGTVPEHWAEIREELAADVRRVSDRLRHVSEAQLATPAGPYATRADAGRHAAQALATAAQALEEGAGPASPAWRTVPRLADFAVGDQVAVTGQDLLAAAAATQAGDEVATPDGRRPAAEVVRGAADLLATVRRLL